MQSFLPRPFQRSLLVSVGLLMSAVVALAILSMLISGFVAQTTGGLAAAVNQSGSLRMQSYRIGMALADSSIADEQRAERVSLLTEEFERRLASRRLADAISVRADDEIRAGYDRIAWDWRERMLPTLLGDLERLFDARRIPSEEVERLEYLEHVDGFVEGIDTLVGQLEAITEGRIEMLQLIQAVALILTFVVVLITMTLLRSRVIQPLGALLECADRSRRGDFTARTPYTGGDELGRVGEAVNRMAEDLSCLCEDLEARVKAKTRDLERTNHSLELLYGVGQTLHESPISAPMLSRVLREIRDQLKLHAVTLCLQDGPDSEQGRYRVTTRSDLEQRGACSKQGCLACRDAAPTQPFSLPIRTGGARPIVAFAVTDQERPFGVLIVDLEDGQVLPAWQGRLLGSLAALIGTALSQHQRQREGRRLSLHEERGIIARELHDSLAQSLSYLKIQAARLDILLRTSAEPERTRAVLAELREGISSAYRQLRELLSTFRLKMDDRGLSAALEATVAEYSERSTTEIRLENRLPTLLLSPNEEIHVLQIVREALSNVIQHAGARRAMLRLAASGPAILVTLEDDGRGMDPGAPRPGHYGLHIMRERAASLGGAIEVSAGSQGGTRVRLTFPHRDAREEEPEQIDMAQTNMTRTIAAQTR
jgi:two-component system, NarL family, nitrate/nitrite sensor histidine kinase NarX